MRKVKTSSYLELIRLVMAATVVKKMESVKS